jgi:hypothetical protein
MFPVGFQVFARVTPLSVGRVRSKSDRSGTKKVILSNPLQLIEISAGAARRRYYTTSAIAYPLPSAPPPNLKSQMGRLHFGVITTPIYKSIGTDDTERIDCAVRAVAILQPVGGLPGQ